LQGDPLTGATTLQALIAETLDLVNETMPHIDTTEARAIFTHSKAKVLLPTEYARPTVQENLDFGPRQNWYVLAEREDWLFLTTWLCSEFHALLKVLAGLNQVEVPLYRWTAWRPSVIHFEHFCANLTIAPKDFKARSIEILQSLTSSALPLLDALMQETFALVAEHCSDIDTTVAHSRYLEERQPWEQMPLNC
jgi:hypothetical protein